MWLRNQRFQRWIGGSIFERLAIRFAAELEMAGMSLHKDSDTTRLIRRVRSERRWLITTNEAFMVFACARAQSSLEGDLAEVGVYEGGSAKLICEAKQDRTFHVFDTFAGLPEPTGDDRLVHRAKLFSCSLESVSKYLGAYSNLHFYPGLFPDTAGPVTDRRFSFVHLDVDLYDSTLACLEFFYPRMVPGGVILSHDYSVLAGVKRAFSEFLTDRAEPLLELPSTQCMLIKQ